MNAARGDNKSTSVSSVFCLPTLYLIPPPPLISRDAGKAFGSLHSHGLKEDLMRRLRATRFAPISRGDNLHQDETWRFPPSPRASCPCHCCAMKKPPEFSKISPKLMSSLLSRGALFSSCNDSSVGTEFQACSWRRRVGLDIWTLNRLLGMVSWVEETLGDEDGGQKDNSALWQTDNPLRHLPSNSFQVLRQIKSKQFTHQFKERVC